VVGESNVLVIGGGAPGSMPRKFSIPGAEAGRVVTVKEALDVRVAPKSALIIGGGVIGLELATFWASLGCTVSIAEAMPQVIPDEDHEVGSFIERALSGYGVQVYTGAEIQRIDNIKGRHKISIFTKGSEHKVEAEMVVFAIGQSPRIGGLGLEHLGVSINKGRIQTNRRMETSVDGIYAAGDATGEIMLANVATVQGSVAAGNAMGRDSVMDYRVVPRGIRTFPEVGAVGITEQEAREKEMEVKIGRYPFATNAKASMLRQDRVKFWECILSALRQQSLYTKWCWPCKCGVLFKMLQQPFTVIPVYMKPYSVWPKACANKGLRG
jgi:dihydrolipoamide dehydrogenase